VWSCALFYASVAVAANRNGTWQAERILRNENTKLIAPLPGGFGVGQLQWRPGSETTLVATFFDYGTEDAVLATLSTEQSGNATRVAQLHASIFAGNARWSPNGEELAFMGFDFDTGAGTFISSVAIGKGGEPLASPVRVATTEAAVFPNSPLCWVPDAAA
jgi:hypothetical protein